MNTDTPHRFAALLRDCRKRAGLTLREVAAESHLSISHLSDVERGRAMPSIEVMDAVLAVYGMRLEITAGAPADEAYERGYADALRHMGAIIAGLEAHRNATKPEGDAVTHGAKGVPCGDGA